MHAFYESLRLGVARYLLHLVNQHGHSDRFPHSLLSPKFLDIAPTAFTVNAGKPNHAAQRIVEGGHQRPVTRLLLS